MRYILQFHLTSSLSRQSLDGFFFLVCTLRRGQWKKKKNFHNVLSLQLFFYMCNDRKPRFLWSCGSQKSFCLLKHKNSINFTALCENSLEERVCSKFSLDNFSFFFSPPQWHPRNLSFYFFFMQRMAEKNVLIVSCFLCWCLSALSFILMPSAYCTITTRDRNV